MNKADFMAEGDNKFETIKPAEITLTQPVAATETPSGAAWLRRIALPLGLAICLLLALMVIFVLPEMVRPPERLSSTAGNPTASTPDAAPPPVKESPFQEAQLAQARRQSQDILASLLEKQKYLEGKNVQFWAQANFQQAIKTAAEGDLAYRQRDFHQALSLYQQAQQQLQDLEKQVPQVLANALAGGLGALNSNDADAATQQFNLALAIDPNNAQAQEGLGRSQVLDEVLAAVADGNIDLANGRLESAKQHFADALAKDAKHPDALAGQKAVAARLLEQNFNAAMSQGYGSLQSGNLTAAEAAFNRALKLKPDSGEARAGLAQARNQSAQLSVLRLLEQAKSLEQKEQWRDAEQLYRKILDRDSAVIDAKIGAIRADARANLDEQLQKNIDDPLRLTTPTVHQHAQQLLDDARGISNPGPRLQSQVQQLTNALRQSTSPVAVTLQSDNQTLVTLFKVGKLGAFTQKTLQLKPGHYVAIGTRQGYRDVRVEFRITGEGQPAPILITCKEPI